VSRTRSKSQGRRGGEGERFAFIPESLLLSPAGKTLPHAAMKVLAILSVGRTRERNGTMCCSESYAMKYGINSRATVRRSLEELQRRGIIVITRRVTPFKKYATLFGVTWWPIFYRDGEPLSTPEPASVAYLKWQATTPVVGVETAQATKIPSHLPRDSLTPIAGVENVDHHTHGDTKVPILHTHDGGKSLDLGSGVEGFNGSPHSNITSSGVCAYPVANRNSQTMYRNPKKVSAMTAEDLEAWGPKP
jgi:hypothetical protein